MAVKTITITEDAYEAVKRMKGADESFSELFRRLGQRQLTIKNIIGALKHTPEEAKEFARRIREERKRINEDLLRREKNVRARFKRAD